MDGGMVDGGCVSDRLGASPNDRLIKRGWVGEQG